MTQSHRPALEDTGSGLDYGSPPDQILGDITPVDQFFISSHAPSPAIDASTWNLRIEVSEHTIEVPWNTEDYVLIADDNTGGRSVITEPALSTLVELPWPAALHPGTQLIRGRAFAGEGRITLVEWRIDDGPWTPAAIISPGGPGVWARWQLRWTAEPGEHTLRVRATDDRGRVQPESTPPNALGYMHESVLAHPVHVTDG
ncbi:MAG: hypothetical protein U1C73_13455 [Dietzia sp.]|nr:hypothetical protein [Dietzia sp.]